MTASTRTVTLSRVMPSWEGTAIVMICMFTFSRRSAIGDRNQHRESRPAEAGLHTAEPEDDAAFELLDDLNSRSEPEHTDADRCGQRVEGDHFCLQSARASAVVLVSALGLLLPMKRHSFRQSE